MSELKLIKMQVKQKPYVGELIRKHIKDQRLTNSYVIHRLNDSGIKMPDSKFSNKIYGQREVFTEEEITAINIILGTEFK